MRISKSFAVSILIATLAMASLQAAAQSSPPPGTSAQSLTEDELRVRTQKLLANQHSDDRALELYDRVERHIDRSGGANPRTIDDKTYRVVPTGMGNTKILLREEGKPTDAPAYAQQLQTLEDVLQTMANPDDPKAKAAYAKFQKRMHERAQFVDAASEAYTAQWVARESWNGHECDVIALDPNPQFQPHSMFQDAFAHTTAKLWVDHQAIQIVHGEAHVTSDISFGGGILGKLYRGSLVSMDQAEIAPGIWLPTHYQYDFAGRKFLFSFDQHQVIDVTRYRRIGPPKQALEIVQGELSSGKTFSEDP
ncbi:MAG TPA: hypothetical protein VNV41_02355 [Candidatus Acidoferrales bacterium]|jgi:hypothetical protein|nr:hypothetical protein [Candidatus Acidoferrales bacterium]